MAEVTLYGTWRCPDTFRVKLALKLKGVKYDYVEEDLTKKSSFLINYNPILQNVPVMLHDGIPIIHSHIILEYIDETWKSNPILPLDPSEKSRARFMARFIDDMVCTTATMACWGGQPMVAEKACTLVKTLEEELSGKKFFGGDNIGIVDIAASSIALWLPVMQEVTKIELVTAEKFPQLLEWMEQFLTSETVRETLPPLDDLIAFYQNPQNASSNPDLTSQPHLQAHPSAFMAKGTFFH